MTTNWENALKSITDHSQALALVILDGSTRYAWCQPKQILPLAKPEALLQELPVGTEAFRAARLGAQPCLLYLVSQSEGSRCAFIYPLNTHLSAANSDAQAFLKFSRLAPPVSLDSLKARDLHAYKHTPENDTWQTEFLSMYSDVDHTDHALISPAPDDDSDTQPVPLFHESTQPILISAPESTPAISVGETDWVKII
ncbi:MAG: hypothetical protein WBI14_09465 [Anaerolineaceae bacterium]